MHMRMRGVNRTWLMAVLLAVVMAGCGREQGATTTTTPPPAAVVAPQVSSTNPPNLFDCEPINRKITAAFTKPMDPLTITTATFLVTGALPVTGTVALDATNNIAYFTPTGGLGLDS